MRISGAYAHGSTQASIFMARTVQFLRLFAAGNFEIPICTTTDELKGKGAVPGRYMGTGDTLCAEGAS